MILACEDEVYAERFLIYVSSHYPNLPYEWHIFTQENQLCTYLAGKRTALLLISERMAHGMLKSRQNDGIWEAAECRVMLMEKAAGCMISGWHALSRYQSMPVLMGKLLTIYARAAENTESLIPAKTDMQMIGVYSPCGRCGKTSLALALGTILAKEKPTLFLDFEWCSGFSSRFGREYERNLADFLGDILEGKNQLTERLAALTVKCGSLDYLPPLKNREDIWDTDKETWQELVTVLRERTGYEALICDFGQGVRGLNELLGLCDRIFLPTLPDPVSRAKSEEFITGLQNVRWQNIAGKIERVPAQEILRELALSSSLPENEEVVLPLKMARQLLLKQPARSMHHALC